MIIKKLNTTSVVQTLILTTMLGCSGGMAATTEKDLTTVVCNVLKEYGENNRVKQLYVKNVGQLYALDCSSVDEQYITGLVVGLSNVIGEGGGGELLALLNKMEQSNDNPAYITGRNSGEALGNDLKYVDFIGLIFALERIVEENM